MIAVEHRDGVAEVVLDRAPCNEIGPDLIEGLERFVEDFDATATHAVILRSAQARGFSAGADLRTLHANMVDRSPEEWIPELTVLLGRIHAVFDALDALPVTTIAVVHGVCFGGGLELALTCDVRIAERSARFAFPELRLGLVPGFGGIPRLERDVGHALARDLFLTGRSVGARRAVEVGLASQLVAPGRGAEAARRLAAQAGKFDAHAVRAGKAFVKKVPRARLDEEKQLFLELVQRPAVRAALRAFCESDDVLPYLA